MLKSQDWYCFSVDADINTKYDLDYLITGLNPEQVDFEARQGTHEEAKVVGQRSQQLEVASESNDPI